MSRLVNGTLFTPAANDPMLLNLTFCHVSYLTLVDVDVMNVFDTNENVSSFIHNIRDTNI
jgi:hypothetical protein